MAGGAVGGDIRDVDVDDLLLDDSNPRFAGSCKNSQQSAIVDFLANEFGLNDLLSSMSRSGYYRSSPLIGVEEGDSIVVVEGNRRLASVLILLGDSRAKNQLRRAARYDVSDEVGDSLRKLPVLLVSDRKSVLAHLGVAHIVGNKTWDSYAKAAWAASVEDEGLFPDGLSGIANAIGDQHRTLERMVLAYRFVSQLQGEGRFDPTKTMKTGRGSARYPFSWVYTALGHSNIREFVGIPKPGQLASPREPVPESHLERAEDLLDWLLGDEENEIAPAISESRDIPKLAEVVQHSHYLPILKQGRTAAEVLHEAQPTVKKLLGAMLNARVELEGAAGTLGSSGQDLSTAELEQIEPEVKKLARLVVGLRKRLEELRSSDFDELGEIGADS